MVTKVEPKDLFTEEEVKTVMDAMDAAIKSTERQINQRTGAIRKVFEGARDEQQVLKAKLHAHLTGEPTLI